MKYLKIIGLLFVIIIYSACNSHNDTMILNGLYTETYPVNGRSQLNFINGNIVIKSENDNSIEDQFTYEIIGNILKLTPIWNTNLTQEFEIKIINNSKFEIENLYPSIEFNPTIFMTFEK